VQNKDGGLSAAHAELELKLQQQQEQFLAANKHIRTHLDNTRAQYEAEKRKLISDQIAFAKNSVNQYLFRCASLFLLCLFPFPSWVKC
jgi:predicted restriction endonuclease